MIQVNLRSWLGPGPVTLNRCSVLLQTSLGQRYTVCPPTLDLLQSMWAIQSHVFLPILCWEHQGAGTLLWSQAPPRSSFYYNMKCIENQWQKWHVNILLPTSSWIFRWDFPCCAFHYSILDKHTQVIKCTATIFQNQFRKGRSLD